MTCDHACLRYCNVEHFIQPSSQDAISPIHSCSEERRRRRTGRRNICATVQIDIGVDRYSRPRRATIDGLLGGIVLEVSIGIYIHFARGGRETTDVRRRHGCPIDGIGGGSGANPGCRDGNAGRVDVDAGPPIGEAGGCVIDVDGADGDGFARGSRGVIACVCVTISSRDDEGDATLDGVVHSDVL